MESPFIQLMVHQKCLGGKTKKIECFPENLLSEVLTCCRRHPRLCQLLKMILLLASPASKNHPKGTFVKSSRVNCRYLNWYFLVLFWHLFFHLRDRSIRCMVFGRESTKGRVGWSCTTVPALARSVPL